MNNYKMKLRAIIVFGIVGEEGGTD